MAGWFSLWTGKDFNMSQYQFGVIGGGNMAEAILRGVIRGNFLEHNSIVVSEPVMDRRRHIGMTLNISAVDDNAVAARCPRILLAIKPQKMGEVLAGISSAVGADATVISIAAGISAAFIDKALGHRGRIVRVMPNTPMLVGAGMSAMAAGPRATAEDMAFVQRLFGVCGRVTQVEESQIDAVTAVSGSGPAYFFYMTEAMIEAGIAEGLDSDTARLLAIETCLGAGKMLSECGEDPSVLRARVTSPNGTTQRAIETMDAAKVKQSMVTAIRAAAQRSRELAGG